MVEREKTIYVYADWLGAEPILIGTLYSNSGRGKEVFSFEYDENRQVRPMANQ